MVASLRKRAGLAMLAAAAGAGSLIFTAGTASAATPFDCTGQVFLAQTPSGATGSRLYSGAFGQGTISFAPTGPVAADQYNAIGYNPNDNFIYGIRVTNGGLWRVDATGAVTGFGPPTGLPAPGATVAGVTITGYNIGAFDDRGLFYVTQSNVPRIWVIDVATNRVVSTINLTAGPAIADMVYSNGYFWGATGDGSIVRVNPNTGAVQTYAGAVPAGAYGGVFAYGNGDIGFYDNAGLLRRVTITNPGAATPTFTLISTQSGPSSGNNDATSCIAPPADLSIAKSGPAAVGAGGTVTYTITVHNNGPGRSSGYTVTDTLPAGLSNAQASTPGCTVSASTLTCTGGALASGADAVITVSGVADGTMTQLANTATVRGNDPDPNPVNDTSGQVITVVDVPLVSAGVAMGAAGLLGAGWVLRRRARIRRTTA